MSTKPIFLVIQQGYEGIQELIYASTNVDSCLTRLKFIKADISLQKKRLLEVGKEKWQEMFDNEEISFKEFSAGKWLDSDDYCLQKFDGENFACCCNEFGIGPSKSKFY